jgi:uncharacterized membrane protein
MLTGTFIAFNLIWTLVSTALLVISIAKGRYAFSVVAFWLLPIAAIFSAARLGREDSMWAKWRYNEDKLTKTRARYSGKSRFTAAFWM